MVLDKNAHRGRVGRIGLAVGVVLGAGLCIPISSWAFGKQASPPSAPIRQKSIESAIEIHATIYTMPAGPAGVTVNHQDYMRRGSKCTDCHRSAGQNGMSTFSGAGLVMAVPKTVIQTMVDTAPLQGGVLLAKPSIITPPGKAAAVKTGPADDGRTIEVTVTPRPVDDGSMELSIRITETLNDKTIANLSGKITAQQGEGVVLVDSNRRRLVILDISWSK